MLLGLARGWGAGEGPHAILACLPGVFNHYREGRIGVYLLSLDNKRIPLYNEAVAITDRSLETLKNPDQA